MSDSVNDDNGSSIQTSHSSDAEEPRKLSDLLREGWEAWEEAEDACGGAPDEPGGGGGGGGASSALLQRKVRHGVAALAEASRLASRLGLFVGDNDNEALDEVATADLRYLPLPALQGALAMRLVGGVATEDGDESRLEAVRSARAHFYAFLLRCRDYGVATFPMPRRSAEEEEEGDDSRDGEGERLVASETTPTAATAAAQRRQAKVERYHQRKETEARLEALRGAVESGRADDGDVRDFHLLTARRWVALALEEVESIDREMPLLLERRRRRRRSSSGRSPERDNPPLPAVRPPAPGGPFVLARGAAQARVFGAGYPSQPSMTVDDWYEQHAARGALPDRGLGAAPGRRPRRADPDEAREEQEEDEEKQNEEEEEDEEEALQKARDWDEWKDCHRRGYGNRQNRS